jgi:hypothetical protein
MGFALVTAVGLLLTMSHMGSIAAIPFIHAKAGLCFRLVV